MHTKLSVFLPVAAICIAAFMVLASCAGSHAASNPLSAADSVQGLTNPTGLPAPSMLVRSTSAAETVVDGGSFEPAWPLQQVVPSGSTAQFSPVSPGTALSDAAYALYRMSVPSVDDHYILQLAWGNAAAAGNLWIALADFEADAWQMFPMTDSSVLPLAAGDLVEGGEIWAGVLCFGEAPWQLDSLSLLGAQAPEPVPVDFTLRLLDSDDTITLSDYRADRPVVLFMGSYT